MGTSIKTLLGSLIVICVLIGANIIASITIGGAILTHISLFCFIEGAILMFAAGVMDLNDSAVSAAIRRVLFRSGESWTYKNYRAKSNIKKMLLFSGIGLFVLSIIVVL